MSRAKDHIKQLIITADDFGASLPINEAVELGHRNGILTSASLMITGEAVEDAVRRARRLPSLAVGLHLTLIDGKPQLPANEVSEIIGPDGRFFPTELPIVFRLTFSARARAQAEAEARAQLNAYQRTGLPLDHVDGHHHLHLHPHIQRILVRLAPEFGIRHVRIPHEPFDAAWRAMRNRPVLRFASAAFLGCLTAGMRRRLGRAGIAGNDQVFGLIDSGHMRSDRIKAFLRVLPDGVSELYLHPATRRPETHDTLPPDYEPEAEYAALSDSGVRNALSESGARLTTFGALADIRGAAA